MPISGPSSFIPTTEAFLNHWGDVNAALPVGSPLVIPGAPIGFSTPVTHTVLQTLYTTLVTHDSTVQSAITDDDLAREDLADKKTFMLDKLNQFNEKVRGLLPGTKWERRLPLVPSIGDARSRFIEPLETAVNLWTHINDEGALGAGVTLTLRDDYLEGDLDSDVGDLRARYQQLGQKDDALGLDREERNDVQDQIYPVLKQYRVLMPTFFPPDSALVASLPVLTPTGTRTPDAVVATGSWDAVAQAAKIEWAPSADPDLDHYEVRWSPGTTYHTDEESTLGTIQPDAGRVFESNQGLAVSGNKSLFRVYVVLGTGNEAGSNTVQVMRV